jgi:aldehyde dehydrogenase (NAD+)
LSSIESTAHKGLTGGQIRTDLYIAGRTERGNGETFSTVNPATEQEIAVVAGASSDQVSEATSRARALWEREGLGDAESRSATLSRLADVIEARVDEILSVVVDDVGTPVTTARSGNCNDSVAVLRWFADAALIDRTVDLGYKAAPSGGNYGRIIYRPVGPVAGLTGYNYPVNSAIVKIGAAFAAGCPIVILPAPQSPLGVLMLADFLDEAGFPPGSVSIVAGDASVGKALVADQNISKISFTGSVPTGSLVMKSAADGIRQVTLELGGKSAAIVLPEADLADVVEGIHHRYLRNAGQGCGSPNRLLVHESLLDEFVDRTREVYEQLVVGDPWHPATLVGPVISRQHKEKVEGYIRGALSMGGEVIAGGGAWTDSPGWYVRPTLVGGVSNRATINQEEIFGPVGTLQSWRTIDEAIDLANDSIFGLHAAIYGNPDTAFELAPRLDVGSVTINGGGGRRRPDISTGGKRQSGIGREKGEIGLREFLAPTALQWPE